MGQSEVPTATSHPVTRSARIGFSVAMGAALSCAVFPGWTVPLQVEGLTGRFGWSEASAGAVTTLELLSSGLFTMALTPLLPKLRPRLIALTGVAGALIGFLLLMMAKSNPGLVIGGFLICGLGQGAANAGAAAVAAAAPDRDRSYAVAVTISILFSALWLVLLPLFPTPTASIDSGFLGSAVAMAACLAALFIPLPGARGPPGGEARAPLTISWLAAAPLASNFLLFGAITAVWAFAVELGAHVGFSERSLGPLLSGAAVASAVGPLLVSKFTAGRAAPIALALTYAVTGAGLFFACLTGFRPVFVVAIVGQAISQISIGVLVFALSFRLDPTGRLSALGGSFVIFGCAIGPALGGVLIGLGPVILGAACVALSFGAWVAIAWFEKQTRPAR